MLKYIARRLVLLVPILFGVSVIVFLVMRLLPGDVVTTLLGAAANASPEVRDQIRSLLGIDRPFHEQYAVWIWRALHGDLGISILSTKPVMDEILRRLPITGQLALFSLALATAVGIPLGVLSATRRNGPVDALIRVGSLIALSVPGFWLATLLILGASRWVPSWPTLGYVLPQDDLFGNLKAMALPTLALSAYLVAGTIRMTRSAMLEVLAAEYVTAARARGLAEAAVLFRHALRNALIPVVTLLGLWLGSLLGGAVLIETVFTLPGMGKMLVDGIQNRDYPAVQGAVLILATSVVVANLLVDVLYGLLDPRVRYE
jgi:peptide/nickel transport system permease protein